MSLHAVPLVVVVGRTASGKSALALWLARQFNGEIVAADSRTLYKGMDIGTAKPSPEERKQVQHHLIDVTTPDKPITVAEYKRMAQAAIADIAARDKLPLLVGGSGLYVDAVIFNYSFRGHAKPELRQQLASASVGELQAYLRNANISLPVNQGNPRHLIRQIEAGGAGDKKSELRPQTLVLGFHLDKFELEQRIRLRISHMFQAGLEQEVTELAKTYGWQCQALQTIGYQEFQPYFRGLVALSDVEEKIVHNTMRYAKRQYTWFKRNSYTQYICKKEEAVDLVTTLLNN